MGRGGGRSSSPSRGSSRSPSRSSSSSAARAPPPAARATPPPPAPTPQAHAPATQQSSGGGGMMAGLGATMAQGMAFGAGSSMARMAVGSLFGGGGSSHAPQEQQHAGPAPVEDKVDSYQGACKMDHKQLTECLNSSTNANNCDFYFTALQNCQANSE